MMAHFKAKIQEKTLESPKSNVVEGQMSAILRQTEVIGKGGTQKSHFKVFFGRKSIF